jgi:NAD(P)-dependent dehydrogenase (short-subunit alcohol dehydrogenase family)
MLSQQAAIDYGPQKVRVNAICPGVVKTPMAEKDLGEIAKIIGMDNASFFDMIAKVTPLQRFAEPMEMGGICTFLASDDSSFITGAAIAVDAGTTVVDVIGAEIMGTLRRHYEQR